MGEAKPTPGPWWLDEYGNLRCGVPVYRDRVLITGISMPTGNSKDYEEAKANRDLLFDAGTVFHTTGLTPSQLVERVKELEEALTVAVNQNEHDMLMTGEELRAARAALSKARPNTAEGEAAQQAPAAGAVAGPTDYVPMLDDEGRMMVGTSHHYTAANIRALVAEYKALEAGAPEALERYSNSDHRTRAGVLWRVISALADEVPIAAQADSQPAPRWNDFAGDLSKQGQLVITLENVNEGKQWHATSNHSERIVVGQFDAQEALRLALENAGNKAGAA